MMNSYMRCPEITASVFHERRSDSEAICGLGLVLLFGAGAAGSSLSIVEMRENSTLRTVNLDTKLIRRNITNAKCGRNFDRMNRIDWIRGGEI